MSSLELSVLYLQVTAEPDPGALARVLERFQNLNVLPRSVRAEWATTGVLHVEVQIAGLSEHTFNIITDKIAQVPCILNAYWHR